MALADSLGPLIVKPSKRPDAQASSRPAAEPLTPEQRERVRAATAAQRSELPLQGSAKSKHPDYAKKTLYVRRSTMVAAMRKYEDGGGTEKSELVQMLLERYVGGSHA